MSSQTLGWIAWVLLCFFAVTWVFGCYSYIRRRVGVTYATINTTVLWWLLLGWTFYYSGMNKLHLLWLAPAAVPLSSFITLSSVVRNIDRKRAVFISPGLMILLAGYIAALWWLTPQGQP